MSRRLFASTEALSLAALPCLRRETPRKSGLGAGGQWQGRGGGAKTWRADEARRFTFTAGVCRTHLNQNSLIMWPRQLAYLTVYYYLNISLRSCQFMRIKRFVCNAFSPHLLTSFQIELEPRTVRSGPGFSSRTARFVLSKTLFNESQEPSIWCAFLGMT